MKKIFVYMTAALALAASCNKIEELNTPVDTPAETEIITVELNPQTKTSLDGTSTVWTAGDKVNVTVGEEVIGTLTLISGSTFKGEITAGLEGGTSVTLNYPVDEDGKTVTTVPATQTAAAGSFAQGAALLEGTTTVADLRAKKGATLANTTALLQFSVAQAGDVTFEVGTTKYTVTGCKTGETYYACVEPAENISFVARIGGYTVKEALNKVSFSSNKIAKLGALPYNVYLHAKTTKYDWTMDNARFATWTWGNGVQDSWFEMVAEGHDGVYRLEVPTGYQNLIFCRMASDKGNDWPNVWNQTADLVIPTDENNHFYISDSGNGAWGDKEYVFPVVKPVDGYLYLKPSSEWLQANAQFVAWAWPNGGNGKAYNFKPHSSVSGLYELNLNDNNNVIIIRMNPSTTITDGSESWPGDGWNKSGNLSVNGNNMCTVTGWSTFKLTTVEEL